MPLCHGNSIYLRYTMKKQLLEKNVKKLQMFTAVLCSFCVDAHHKKRDIIYIASTFMAYLMASGEGLCQYTVAHINAINV